MGLTEGRGPRTIWDNPADIIRQLAPDNPVMVLDAQALRATARRFLDGFPGLVTYAVKSNPDKAVIRILSQAGIRGFDVASPQEIDLIGRLAPGAARHYHNPVRSTAEIGHAVRAGITAWSVDSHGELQKLLHQLPAQGCEIAARFKLPVPGAVYDFGAKFGAVPDLAADLLRTIAQSGHRPSLTFHPGTQCTDAQAWDSYIRTARRICDMAGVRAWRLNVGGGFPSFRQADAAPDLEAIFDQIDRIASPADRPDLVCEPGRALCGDAFSLITRVKAIRDDGSLFLNDGLYGALYEMPVLGNLGRLQVLDPHGMARDGALRPRIVFGPTCDSMDRLPGELSLPDNMQEGDYLIFHGAGAYSTVTNTQFNGFGQLTHLSVKAVS